MKLVRINRNGKRHYSRRKLVGDLREICGDRLTFFIDLAKKYGLDLSAPDPNYTVVENAHNACAIHYQTRTIFIGDFEYSECQVAGVFHEIGHWEFFNHHYAHYWTDSKESREKAAWRIGMSLMRKQGIKPNSRVLKFRTACLKSYEGTTDEAGLE